MRGRICNAALPRARIDFAAKFKDDFFLALYREHREWRRAFEWAADGGMVHFS